MVDSTSSSTAGAALTPDQMLANVKNNTSAANNSTSSDSSAKSSDEMLAHVKGTSTGDSAVKKLLAAHPITDTVELSPVAKLIAASAPKAATTTDTSTANSYYDSDAYITAKVAALKGEIATYTNLPGLDPSGGVLDDLTKQVNDLVTKQNAKLKAAKDATAAKQAELDKANAAKYQGVSSKDMLTRTKSLVTTGKLPDAPLSTAAQALVDKVTGKSVDKTA